MAFLSSKTRMASCLEGTLVFCPSKARDASSFRCSCSTTSAFLCASGRLLPLHFLTFIVLLVCVAESAAAFAGYLEQNRTGQPQCCPFPRIVVASMVLELLRRGATRVLLLVVSLGYGLVRPRLRRTEECGVIVLTAAYVTAVFCDDRQGEERGGPGLCGRSSGAVHGGVARAAV